MPTSCLPNPRLVLALAVAGFLGWAVLTVTRPRDETRPESDSQQDASQATPAAVNPAGDPTAGVPARSEDPPQRPAWDRLVESIAAAATPEDARSELDALRGFLLGLDPSLATNLIRAYLADGGDATLPLEFAIGTNGFLESPTTLRVALLDLLGQIDPEASAELGREILVTPTTADEWAVSLRNVARGETGAETRDFLRGKTEELIRNEEWQASPSIGYLNAFDVLVHTRATESTPLLSELIQRKERRDLAHAGFLTLDRLTQREPTAMLHRLAEDAELQQSRPEMVAQQFARADLREPDQRTLVRAWLLAPNRTATELQAFAGTFPNNNQMISRNLLTREEPVPGAELLDHDREVLAIISQWQQDEEFAPVRPHLDLMAQRLATFIRQGGG